MWNTHSSPLWGRPRTEDSSNELVLPCVSLCVIVLGFFFFGTFCIDMPELLMMPNEWVGPQCNCYLGASGAIMCHLYAQPKPRDMQFGCSLWLKRLLTYFRRVTRTFKCVDSRGALQGHRELPTQAALPSRCLIAGTAGAPRLGRWGSCNNNIS